MQTDSQENGKLAGWGHVAPFAAWIILMVALGEPAGWKYAVRTAVSLALFLALRPWRWYAAPRLGPVLLAVPAGLFVFVVWVGFERWAPPAISDLYLRWAVLPFGRLPAPLQETPYAPAVCGWPLTLVRLGGSAFVIAAIEEFFWRGFLYRWLLARPFQKVDLGRLDVPFFLLVSALFGFEHSQWLAGMVAGLVYGGLIIGSRSIWPGVTAHVVTNLLLGLYVLARNDYGFW